MDELSLNAWSSAYLKLLQHDIRSPEYNDLDWAYEEVVRRTEEDPESVWQFLDHLSQQQLSDVEMARIAAGPLEDLLVEHGSNFIDRVETLAKSRPRFAQLLGGVWKSDIPDAIWQRIVAVRAGTW